MFRSRAHTTHNERCQLTRMERGAFSFLFSVTFRIYKVDSRARIRSTNTRRALDAYFRLIARHRIELKRAVAAFNRPMKSLDCQSRNTCNLNGS